MVIYPNLHMLMGEKKGLGDAYKRGMGYAISELNPDLILEMDADLQHDPSLLPLFISMCNHGFSLVIGSRFAPGGQTINFSFRRKLLSYTGNWLVRFFGGLPRIHDCTSGYRCIKADLIPKCDLSNLSTQGYSFQSSLLCELLQNGARVIEIPIIFKERMHGSSKLSIHDQIEFLLNVVKIRFRRLEDFIRFCVAGITGVALNLGLYLLLTRMSGVSIEAASPIAIELSILWTFFLTRILANKKTAGDSEKPAGSGVLHELIQFHTAAGLAGAANYSVLLLLVKGLGAWDIGAYITGICLSILFKYYIISLRNWDNIRERL